jgi:VIT1/CCC1 family predicted Fe2+/Mn2+ transporter
MMRFELGLEKPDPKRAFVSALTIALSYVAGGLIPLAPYIVATYVHRVTIIVALMSSVGLTLVALFIFGFVKGRFTGTRPCAAPVRPRLIGSPGGARFDCASDA